MSNDPKDPPQPPAELFPFDEMSTGETSSLTRRALQVTGAPDRPTTAQSDPALKPMTGAQLAFRPSAPPRPATGAHPALQRPGTGTQPAFKPTTGTQPAFRPNTSGSNPAYKPTTNTQPAFKPTTGAQPAYRSGSGSHTAVKPAAPSAPTPPPPDEEPPQFDAERLQAQFRHLSLTDSALGRAAAATKAGARPAPKPSSAVEDTFVKRKMKQAEAKVPDFDLDDDLG